MHAASGFAIACTAGAWLLPRTKAARVKTSVILLGVVLATVGIGAVWEIAEFAYDHLEGPGNAIQGKFDTVLDVVYDTIGATLATLWLRGAGGRDQSH
jgi:hypothetical protein